MRCPMIVSLALSYLIVGSARADDQAHAVIEKAIKAHGGEASLTRFKAVKQKVEGVAFDDDREIKFTAKIAGQLPDKLREEIALELGGRKVVSIRVLNGGRAWRVRNGKTEELTGAELEEAKDEAFQNYAESLVPLLKDKQINVTLVGDDKVEDKPVVGVKVSAKGFSDRKFFFDKESGLLAKVEHTLERDGRQLTIESFFSGYKPVNGVMVAMKQVVHRDGKKFIENQATDCQVLEKLDDSIFAKP